MKENAIAKQENETVEIPYKEELRKGFSDAYKLVDDVVLKNYITHLTELPVIPIGDDLIKNNLSKIRLFRITEMVYSQNESATYKFASVFNAVAATESAIITVIQSDGIKTDFYLGIRSLSEENSTQTSYSTLEKAMKGQFPGTKTENLKIKQIEYLLKTINTDSLSSVSCVANNKNKEFIDNKNYLQGLEKLALAMQGSQYTAIIIANSTSQNQLNLVRQGYETIYTQLSPYSSTVVSYGTNNAETKNQTETVTENSSESHSENKSETNSESISKNTGEIKTVSEKTEDAIVGNIIGNTISSISSTLSVAGAVVGSLIPGAGTATGFVLGGAIGGLGGLVGNAIGTAISTATDKTVSTTTGGGSNNNSHAITKGTADTTTKGTSHSLATSLGLTTGESQNLQLTIQNKPLINMLDRIDKQLARLDEFESVGMWECAAYFMSEDPSVSEAAAATYKALMCGDNSGLEVSAINTWIKTPNDNNSESQNEQIAKYVKNFIHPVFKYEISGNEIPVMPTNLVSGNELAIHMGLPRNSVCGFPVIEHADFGKEVVKYDKSTESSDNIKFGCIFNMGRAVEKSEVSLDIESLAMHSLILGSTGSGKSNAIYHILEKLKKRDSISFMVIEPAKGEYKRIFGHKSGVSVFGTNPQFTQLLRINPFKFPKNIHILEHIDRLIEIFNVCWPMYAAMPAVLKEAVIEAYESCGWNTSLSKNFISNDLFPTFQDLQEELVKIIDASSYSDEVKSNYKGSLLTRIKSLTNGLNGMIFTPNEIDNEILFDSNVIVDLSRIGSQETKSLLMGLLIMRLQEYRMDTYTESNSKLKHITVIEEAHNILRRSSSSSTEDNGANISGKSIEMLSNAIAEMRTYGEGFIIADQSPIAIDISAIRNTNTKIIMRLPDEADRRLAGKAAALKDTQLDEIAKLPKGVAVIYQNDWVEPILCMIDKFNEEDQEYKYSQDKDISETNSLNSIVINFIANNRLDNPDIINISEVEKAIEKLECSTKVKIKLYDILKEYKKNNKLSIWNDNKFNEQSKLVRDILRLENAVSYSRQKTSDLVSFNCMLNTLIAQKLDCPSDDLILSLSHCLMKAYSESTADGIEVYKTWHEELIGRGRLL